MSILGRKILNLGNRNKKRPTKKTATGFEQARLIGILFSWEDKQKENQVVQFIETIGEGRKVECLCYNPDRKEIPESQFPLFNLSDLSMLGKIESSETNQFLAQPFDYLFHLDMELNEICQALLSRSQAQYRVGLHTEEGENFYELMIGINKNAGLHNFADQILKYVNAVK